MAITDDVYELKFGANQTLVARLRDKNGAADLTDYQSVHIIVRRNELTPIVLDGACDIYPDQVSSRGFVKHKFVSWPEPGDYRLEFHGIDADGDKHIFPTTFQPAYKKLRCIKALQ